MQTKIEKFLNQLGNGIDGRISKLAIVALLIAAIFAMATTVEARIGPSGSQYDRQAMVYEAYYAVTGQLGNYPTTQTLGRWNYMTYDIPAQNTIIGRLGSYNAGWTTPVVNNYVPNGYVNGIGRGGQCLFFINLLLYRSEADRRDASSGTCNYCWSYIESHSTAIDSNRILYAGDIVFKPRPNQHIALVVYRGADDTVRLVDSNYATGGGNEVAALRVTTISWLKSNGYKVYTGVSYYNN